MKNFFIQPHFLILSLLLLHAAPMQAFNSFTSEDSGNSTQYEYSTEAIEWPCGSPGGDVGGFNKRIHEAVSAYVGEGWSLEHHSVGFGGGDRGYATCLCSLIFKRAINKKVANNQAAQDAATSSAE